MTRRGRSWRSRRRQTRADRLRLQRSAETKAITPSGGSAQALAYGGTGQGDLVESDRPTSDSVPRTHARSGVSWHELLRTYPGWTTDRPADSSGNFNPLVDAQGNIIALVNSSGKSGRTFRYGPYGDNISSEGTQTIPFPFGFQGGYRMPGETRARQRSSNGLYPFWGALTTTRRSDGGRSQIRMAGGTSSSAVTRIDESIQVVDARSTATPPTVIARVTPYMLWQVVLSRTQCRVSQVDSESERTPVERASTTWIAFVDRVTADELVPRHYGSGVRPPSDRRS